MVTLMVQKSYFFNLEETRFTLPSQNYQLHRPENLHEYSFNTQELLENIFTALPLLDIKEPT